MNKLLNSLSLLVAVGFLSTLAGCDLYFHGQNDNNDSWNYCGSDGLYQCQGDNCEWVSNTCPDGTGSGGTGMGGSGGSGGSGYECSSNAQCAAGCYCTASGTCEEGGFCATDADCGSGYHCDTARSSCEPNPPGCTADSCTNGQVLRRFEWPLALRVAARSTRRSPAPRRPRFAHRVKSRRSSTAASPARAKTPPRAPRPRAVTSSTTRTTAWLAPRTARHRTPASTAPTRVALHVSSGDAGCTCASFVFATCDKPRWQLIQ